MYASSPKKMGDVLSQIIFKKGYGRTQSTGKIATAWNQSIDPRFHSTTKIGKISQGKVHVIVANSTVMNELLFSQSQIIVKLKKFLPDEKFTTLKLRVGVL